MPDLPPFPVDDQTLDMLWAAMHPAPDTHTERSSVGDLLTLMSQLGGSDTDAVIEEESTEYIRVMRDQHYHVNNVLDSLIVEIRRLRGGTQ